jgi:HEAT repeats
MRTKLNTTLLLVALLSCTLAACNMNTQIGGCDDPQTVRAAIAPETDPAITAAIEAFAHPSSREGRDTAINTLVKIGPRSIIPLFSLRKNSCYWGNSLIEGMQEVSIRMGSSAIPELITLLKTSDPNSQQIVLGVTQALGQIGKPALPQLMPLLKDPNGQVRLNAIEALGQIGKPAISELISISKQDPDSQLRNRASERLKELGYKTAP